jgi:hypothetical protein
VNTLLSGFFPLLSANVYLLVSGLGLEFVRYIELIPQSHTHCVFFRWSICAIDGERAFIQRPQGNRPQETLLWPSSLETRDEQRHSGVSDDDGGRCERGRGRGRRVIGKEWGEGRYSRGSTPGLRCYGFLFFVLFFP